MYTRVCVCVCTGKSWMTFWSTPVKKRHLQRGPPSRRQNITEKKRVARKHTSPTSVMNRSSFNEHNKSVTAIMDGTLESNYLKRKSKVGVWTLHKNNLSKLIYKHQMHKENNFAHPRFIPRWLWDISKTHKDSGVFSGCPSWVITPCYGIGVCFVH